MPIKDAVYVGLRAREVEKGSRLLARLGELDKFFEHHCMELTDAEMSGYKCNVVSCDR